MATGVEPAARKGKRRGGTGWMVHPALLTDAPGGPGKVPGAGFIVMIGFGELLIVILGFSLPGIYLFIVSRFIKESEKATAELDAHRR